jgi:hypothetical protein
MEWFQLQQNHFCGGEPTQRIVHPFSTYMLGTSVDNCRSYERFAVTGFDSMTGFDLVTGLFRGWQHSSPHQWTQPDPTLAGPVNNYF